jgi:hypothetical protein
MVYAEWLLQRQQQAAGVWTGQPGVELPEALQVWQSESTGKAAVVSEETEGKTVSGIRQQTDEREMEPAAQLLEALEAGRWQLAGAAAAAGRQTRLTGSATADPVQMHPRRRTETGMSPSAWSAQPAAPVWRESDSMQAFSRYFERDARRYG